MIKGKNYAEFVELYKKYSTMTIEKIDADPEKLITSYKKQQLTGFGSTKSCSLCVAVNAECAECHWKQEATASSGMYCANHMSYNEIEYALTSGRLLAAYKLRAEEMKRLIDEGDVVDF